MRVGVINLGWASPVQRPGAVLGTNRHMWYEAVQPGLGQDVRSRMISLGRVPAGLWADCKTDGGGVMNPARSHFSVIFSTAFAKVCAGFSVERKFTLRMKVSARHQNFNLNVGFGKNLLFPTALKPHTVGFGGAVWFNYLSGHRWKRRSQLTLKQSCNQESFKGQALHAWRLILVSILPHSSLDSCFWPLLAPSDSLIDAISTSLASTTSSILAASLASTSTMKPDNEDPTWGTILKVNTIHLKSFSEAACTVFLINFQRTF